MGLFSKRIPDSQKKVALELVRHLQTMLAYQQLTMEIYNDAASSAGGDFPVGSELGHAPLTLSSPTLVATHIIPALEKKIEILKLMQEKHNLATLLATYPTLRRPYEEMSTTIRTMLDRAHLQYEGYSQWVQDPRLSVDTTRLDSVEFKASGQAIQSLNGLIQKLGLTTDEFLNINRGATNLVRSSLGLPPLDEDDYRSRYFRGLKGERVRFFTD